MESLVRYISKKFLSTPSARRATHHPKPRRKSHVHFYPRPPRGGRPATTTHSPRSKPNFYPRPPRGGRPPCRPAPPGGLPISIHALREEGDFDYASRPNIAGEFLSTPSARRATQAGTAHHQREQFLSTPSARRATAQQAAPAAEQPISIHALREEGDSKSRDSGNTILQFLSTPSARRATACSAVMPYTIINFYPRPPRGGRP